MELCNIIEEPWQEDSLTGEQPISGCDPCYEHVDHDQVGCSMLTDELRAVDQTESKHPPPPPPPPPHTHTHTNCSNCHTTFRDIGETRWNLLTAFSEHMGNPCRKSPGLPFWSRFAFYENYCYDALKLLLWRDKIFNRIIWHWQYFLLLVFVSSFVSFCVYSF